MSSLQINEVDRLMGIIRQAAQEEALVFYTLADPHMAEAAQKACEVCIEEKQTLRKTLQILIVSCISGARSLLESSL